jgi:hypothetical protein
MVKASEKTQRDKISPDERGRTASLGLPVIAILLVLAWALSGCDMGTITAKPTPNPRNIPIFPGAQQVQSKHATARSLNPAQIVTFVTSDQPDQIGAYYKKTLTALGWHYEEWQPYSDAFHFTYLDPRDPNLQTVHVIDVIITIHSPQQTNIEIQVPDRP